MCDVFAPERIGAVADRPGRIRTHPSEECNIVLSQYCKDSKTLSTNAIRAISTAVSRIAEYGLLHTVDCQKIQQFFEIQHEMLSKAEGELPFDVLEISLQFLAAPEMPIELYNDEYIKLIVEKLGNFCDELFKEKNHKAERLHRLYPILRSFAHIVVQCAFSDQILIKLSSMAISSYFAAEASGSLQTAASSLLTAIYRRYDSFRDYIVSEIFVAMRDGQGGGRTVIFPGRRKVQISGPSRLFLELVQSISSFPCDTEIIVRDAIRDIIGRFEKSAIAVSSIAKTFEKVCVDIASVMSHPIYPVALPFLKNLMETQFPLIDKKERLSRVAIECICNALIQIIERQREVEEPVTISFPASVVQFLGFDAEAVNSFVVSEGSHVVLDKGKVSLIIDASFPANQFERLLGRMIIIMFIKQSAKLSDMIETAIPFHLCSWSCAKVSDEEMSTMLMWWRGIIPEALDFDWTIDVAGKLWVHEISKGVMFTRVEALISRLMKGLKNANSAHRASILRGVASLVKADQRLLYHPVLLENIKDAFRDVSATIRESVLNIVGAYINASEGTNSKYFPLVMDCILDPAPSVARNAVNIIGKLAQKADDQDLSILCRILRFKLDDNNEKIRTVSRSVFVDCVFSFSSRPLNVLLNVIEVESTRPSWFPGVFRDEFSSRVDQLKPILDELVDCVCSNPGRANTMLLREFCAIFPSVFVSSCDRLISLFNTSKDSMVLVFLPDVVRLILQRVTYPNINLMNLMVTHMQELIASQGSLVTRTVIELFSSVVKRFLPDCTALDDMQDRYMRYLRSSISMIPKLDANPDKMKSLAGTISRALFVTGCIYRFYGSKNPNFVKNAWGPVNHCFRSKNSQVRSRVLECACDICVRNTEQIDKARALIAAAFALGPPDSVSALDFLARLTQEECQDIDEVRGIDEVRPLYSTSLLQHFGNDISKCFYVADTHIRTQTLNLVRIALDHGSISPMNVMQHVFALFVTKDHCVLACETIAEALKTASGENAVKNRIADGLQQAFSLTRVTHPNGLQDVPTDDPCFNLHAIYIVLPDQMKKRLVDIIVNKINDGMMSDEPDCTLCLWLLTCLSNIQFTVCSEVAYLYVQLSDSSGDIYRTLRTVHSDAKVCMSVLGSAKLGQKNARSQTFTLSPGSWYYATSVIRFKNWIMKRYAVNVKKLSDMLSQTKKAVKLCEIGPVPLHDIPVPDTSQPELTDRNMDLCAQLMSAMRLERAYDTVLLESKS